MKSKARFLPFAGALILIASLFMFSSASAQTAVGTVKLTKNFITTPDGELKITVEDRDLNSPVVQLQEEEGQVRGADGRLTTQTYTIPASCPTADNTQQDITDGNCTNGVGAGATGGYGTTDQLQFRTQKAPLYSGSEEQLYSANYTYADSNDQRNLRIPADVVRRLDSSDDFESVDFQDVVLTPVDWAGMHENTRNAWKALTYESIVLLEERTDATRNALLAANSDLGNVPDTYRHPHTIDNAGGGAFIVSPPTPGADVIFRDDIEFKVTYLAPDVQTAEVSLTSTTDTSGVKMLLLETGPDTGKFEQTFKTITAPQTTHIVDLRPGVREDYINLNLDGLKADGSDSGTTGTGDNERTSPGADITDAEVDDDTLGGTWVTTERNIGIDLNGDGDYTATTTWIDLRQARQARIPPGATLGWRMNLPPTDGADDPQKDLCEAIGPDGNPRGVVEYDQIPEEGQDPPAEDYDITFDGQDIRICWVNSTPTMDDSDDVEDRVRVGIAAATGAQVRVTYDDNGTPRTFAALVETEKPKITVDEPNHKAATRTTATRLVAEITDTDSMVDLTKNEDGSFKYISFNVEATNVAGGSVAGDGVTVGQITTVSISNGVRAEANLQNVPAGETRIVWSVTARDYAGNVATSDQNEADGPATLDDPDTPEDEREAEGANKVEPDLYEFRIDTVPPRQGVITIDYDGDGNADPKSVDGAITGNYIDDDGNVVTDATKGRNTSVRMVFNEEIRADSVQPSDFRVDGGTPVAAEVKGESVFLTVPAFASNARPTVRLAGTIEDLARNTRQGGVRVEEAQDGISPTITVTVNPDYHKSEVTITVDPNEELLTAPIIRLSSDGQDDTDVAPRRGVSGLSSPTRTGTSGNSYQATFRAPVRPFAYNVNVDVLDTSNNPRSAGKAKADDDDATTIEFDNALPAQTSITLPGRDPITTIVAKDQPYPVTTRNPFITIEWDSEGREYGRITDNKATTDDTTDDTAELTNDAADIAAVADDPKLSFTSLDTHGTVDVTRLKIKIGEETYDVDTPMGDQTRVQTELAIDEDTTYTFIVTKPSKNQLLISARGNLRMVGDEEVSGLDLGDYEMSFNGRDELGNTLKSDVKIKFEIKDPDPFEVKLVPGWNLVSLPASPQSTDINDVIPADHPAQTVSTYDPKAPGLWLSSSRALDENGDPTGPFTGTLATITGGLGYWIYTNSFQSIKVSLVRQTGGGVRPLPTVSLVQGWNLIPVLDIQGTLKSGADRDTAEDYLRGDVLRTYQYDSTTTRYTVVADNDNLKIGTGYWVYMSKAKVLVP